MAQCKYCGQETGGSMFCQNCGAKVEAPVQQVPQPQVQAPASFDTAPVQPQMPPQPQAYTSPTTPSFYTPGGAGGLMAGHIILLILGVICCCFTIGITLVSTILSIIGLVYASKVKASLSAEEEAHNRKISMILLIVSIVALVGGLAVLIGSIFISYGSISAFIDAVSESFESAWESASLSAEKANKLAVFFKSLIG